MRAFSGRAAGLWQALRLRSPGSHPDRENPRVTENQGSMPKPVPANRWRKVHTTVEHLYGPEEVSYGVDELIVLCLVRDGRPYLRSFVEHYSSIGVKHLVFLDNGSTDGTVETLKNYDNVTVLRTELPYKRNRDS